MLLMLCAIAAGCVLPFLKPPAINTSFETLTVQGQPINHAVEASALLTTATSGFWGMSAAPPSSDGSGARRRLLAKDSNSGDSDSTNDNVARKSSARSLHVIYHRPDRGTLLTRDMIARIKAVEDEVFALPDYGRMCVQRGGKGSDARDCRRPVSVTSFMFGVVTEDGGFEPNGDSDRMLDPKKSAQVQSCVALRWLCARRGIGLWLACITTSAVAHPCSCCAWHH